MFKSMSNIMDCKGTTNKYWTETCIIEHSTTQFSFV